MSFARLPPTAKGFVVKDIIVNAKIKTNVRWAIGSEQRDKWWSKEQAVRPANIENYALFGTSLLPHVTIQHAQRKSKDKSPFARK